MKMINIKRGWWILTAVLIFLALIPAVTAPYWYGTETGLVSHWTCDGHFNDRIGNIDDEAGKW